MKELNVMKGKVFLGTALSIGLLFSAIPHQEALAAKNVLSVEKYNKHRDSLEYKRRRPPSRSRKKARMNWAIPSLNCNKPIKAYQYGIPHKPY